MSSIAFSPLYLQIRDRLVQGLQTGEWRPGEAIPSETELAGRYGVSQGTVRKAIDALASEHMLIRRQGRGTFVASHQEQRAQFRFLRLRPDEGEPIQPSSRFLACRRLRAPVEISRSLELRAGETVVMIHRLLDFAGSPIVFDEIWLPGARFKGLTAERLNAYGGPLYGLLESEYGTRMIRASERLKAVAAEADQARWLDVAVGAPLLLSERITMTYADRPVEVRRGWYLTRGYHYFNELN